ncbi:MAG: S16 family serine protease [archaeon]
MNKKIIFVFIFLILMSTSIFAYLPKAQMKIFAVNSTNTGMDANLVIEIKPGTGKVFSNVNAQVGSTTQESERNAVNAAERINPEAKDKYDYFFEIQSVASSIDGPSAGAAMALLITSMLNDKDLSGKVSITGTITEDGYVGDVGGIAAKAKKANDVGIKLFMIPAGSRRQAITNDSGNSQLVDLPEYAYTTWGLKVVEVETIEDIKKYAVMDIANIDINNTAAIEKDEYIPETIEYSVALTPMRGIVDKYLIDANNILSRTEDSINNSKIKDSSIVQSLLSLVDYSKEAITQAKKYSANNYMYTAANEAFLAKTYLITIDEIVNNPSIMSEDSTIYNLRIQEVENKITLTENRSKFCSLDRLEWCISAKQRIVWAKNKIKNIKASPSATSAPVDKIMDYSYALAWIEIANDFLDAGMNNNSPNFVESSEFKDLAQKYIVDIENEIVLLDAAAAKDEDILRRLNAAKTNYEMGWYVTALYDAASAKGILLSRKEVDKESFDENVFLISYNELSILKTPKANSESINVWSKLYYDHGLFYYKNYLYYKNKNTTKADGAIKTAYSVVSLSNELYIVENLVHEYYNNAGNIVVEVVDNKNKKVVSENNTSSKPNNTTEKVYVYSKDKDQKNTTILYVIVAGLFLIIISIVIELERYNSKKGKIQKALLELEQKLSEGHISKFTYEDMKKSYLKEINAIEEKGKPIPSHLKQQVIEKEEKSKKNIKSVVKKVTEVKKKR